MNLNLKAVYYCATNNQRWGKGYTIADAKKAAGLLNKSQETRPGFQFYVQAAVFNDPTPDELKNLFACITADQISGGPVYYQDDRTQADTDMINAKHVGWLMIEKTKK